MEAIAAGIIGFLLGAGIMAACAVAGSERHECTVAKWRRIADKLQARAEAAELRAARAEAHAQGLQAQLSRRERVSV